MWPSGMKCAFALTFDLDAESVWIADDSANALRPGVLSQGRYGARVAVPLLLALLEKHELKATFFVVGRVAEDYPDTVRSIAAAGHELAVHGYSHTSPSALSAQEEEHSIIQTKGILEAYQPQVAGYRSPSWDFSEHTLDILSNCQFSYSSNMMDDLRPYLHPGTDVVELPVQWIMDDSAHFWFSEGCWNKKISTPSEVQEIWEAEFEGYYEIGGAFILTCHPQVIGRPHRLKLLEKFVRFVKSHPGVWLATCGEIADHARKWAA